MLEVPNRSWVPSGLVLPSCQCAKLYRPSPQSCSELAALRRVTGMPGNQALQRPSLFDTKSPHADGSHLQASKACDPAPHRCSLAA